MFVKKIGCDVVCVIVIKMDVLMVGDVVFKYKGGDVV